MSSYGARRMQVHEAWDLLEEVVEAKGRDYRYQKDDMWGACEYVHGPDSEAHTEETEGPGCIVGHVAHAWGVPLDQLKRLEGTVPTGDPLFWQENLTPTAAVLLRKVQKAQDTGSTWGDALDNARVLYEQLQAL